MADKFALSKLKPEKCSNVSLALSFGCKKGEMTKHRMRFFALFRRTFKLEPFDFIYRCSITFLNVRHQTIQNFDPINI